MLVQISISLLLVSVFLVDVLHRKVLLVQLLLAVVLTSVSFYTSERVLTELVLNIGWVATQLSVLWFYLMARNKPFLQSFGLGDVLFLFAITPLLSTRKFIVFYVTGLLFGLTIGLFMRYGNSTSKGLPLAGLLSLWLIPFVWFDINKLGGLLD